MSKHSQFCCWWLTDFKTMNLLKLKSWSLRYSRPQPRHVYLWSGLITFYIISPIKVNANLSFLDQQLNIELLLMGSLCFLERVNTLCIICILAPTTQLLNHKVSSAVHKENNTRESVYPWAIKPLLHGNIRSVVKSSLTPSLYDRIELKAARK